MGQDHLLAGKTMRRIFKMQESLFKYGTFIPRNDKEARASPEAVRWLSGRQLEWIRLRTAKTFESDWTWAKIRMKFPDYRKCERSRKREHNTSGSISNNPLFEKPLSLSRRAF